MTSLSVVSIVGGKKNIECHQNDSYFKIRREFNKVELGQKMKSFSPIIIIDILYPRNGSIVSGIVTIMLHIYDQGDIDRVEFYIDDSFKSADITPPYTWSWDTTEETDGYHEIKVIAYDGLGNSASDLVWVIVDNENDEPWIDGPTSGIVGVEYTYCIRNTISVEGIELYAYFDWGRWIIYWMDWTLCPR